MTAAVGIINLDQHQPGTIVGTSANVLVLMQENSEEVVTTARIANRVLAGVDVVFDVSMTLRIRAAILKTALEGIVIVDWHQGVKRIGCIRGMQTCDHPSQRPCNNKIIILQPAMYKTPIRPNPLVMDSLPVRSHCRLLKRLRQCRMCMTCPPHIFTRRSVLKS